MINAVAVFLPSLLRQPLISEVTSNGIYMEYCKHVIPRLFANLVVSRRRPPPL